jgi:hypothetical protein
MTDWRVVHSLLTLIDQVDTAWPHRSKASDGTIGDSAHEPSSDHTPHLYPQLGPIPVVCAADITHDPSHGVDCNNITEAIRLSRDSRVKYLIWSHRMFSSYVSVTGVPPFTWRPYVNTGPPGTWFDPHTSHFHLSTLSTVDADSTRLWRLDVSQPLHNDDDFRALIWRVQGVLGMVDPVDTHTAAAGSEVNQLAKTLLAIQDAVDAIATKLESPRPVNVTLSIEDRNAIVDRLHEGLVDAVKTAVSALTFSATG